MPLNQRNIQFLLAQFGLGNVRAVEYVPNNESLTQRAGEYDLEPAFIEESNKVSYLGTPVFGEVILKSEEQGLEIELQTVLSDVAMTKNIVKTTMQGVDGTIKEYISDGDYEISIRGMLVSEENAYPQEATNTLHQLCLVKNELVVESEFLQLFGIYNLVIESYSFPQQEGFRNIQLFELSAISDKPIELIIEDETLN